MKPTELLDIAIQPGHPLWDTAYNELKQLLQSQRKVSEKEIFDFHGNLQTIVMDCKDQEECIQRELNYIKTWLKELGVEVVE